MRNIPWLDRIGFIVALCALGALAFFWVIGKASLIVAIVALLLFALIVAYAANQADDDPDNNSLTSAVDELRSDARAEWDRVRAAAKDASGG